MLCIAARDGSFRRMNAAWEKIGAHLRDDGTALTLTDATGKDATFPTTRIQSRTTTKFPLMPSVFATQLPATDLHDLPAYLLGGGAGL